MFWLASYYVGFAWHHQQILSGQLWIIHILYVSFLIGCCFRKILSYLIRVLRAFNHQSLLLAAICRPPPHPLPLAPSLSLSPLVTQASQVKSVTVMCFTPTLWPRCTTHHAVLTARHHPLILHANIRFLRPPASQLHHPSIIPLLPLLHI